MRGFSDNIQELAADSATAANEELRLVINAALCEAVDNELMQAATVNELWSIFINALRDFQHAVFLDAMTDRIRDELIAKILKAEYGELREAAVREIIADKEEELWVEALAQFKREKEFDEGLLSRLYCELKNEMKGQVTEELKRELVKDVAFIESAKADLKRSILGL